MNECSGATCSIYQNLKLLGYRSIESIEYKHIFGELALSITFQDFGGFRENFFFSNLAQSSFHCLQMADACFKFAYGEKILEDFGSDKFTYVHLNLLITVFGHV